MDLILLFLAALCMCVGVLGSFVPALPGPPLSWLGLLLLQSTSIIPINLWFLGTTAGIALVVTALDYYLPALGTKKYGGSKKGIWGAILGLLFALFFPVLGLFGFIIWPFVGAYVGEILENKDRHKALKAAWGSFLGFLAGTLLKLVLSLVYFGLFAQQIWAHKAGFLSYF